MIDTPQVLSEHRCFGGMQRFHQHGSSEIGLPMRSSVFLPPQAEAGPVPAVLYLAGLTCTGAHLRAGRLPLGRESFYRLPRR